jgi:hypothetical protein
MCFCSNAVPPDVALPSNRGDGSNTIHDYTCKNDEADAASEGHYQFLYVPHVNIMLAPLNMQQATLKRFNIEFFHLWPII